MSSRIVGWRLWSSVRSCPWCRDTHQIQTDERGMRPCPFCVDGDGQ